MDSAHQRRTSSPPQLPSSLPSTRDFSSVPDATFEHSLFDAEISPSRQQRLLSNRNARFPAKKLSISNLSNKLSQLIGNSETSGGPNASLRDQENSRLHKSKSTGTIGKRSSLGILDEISNSSRSRAQRRRGDIPIYQDNPERPLLQSSPFVSSPFIDPTGDFNSPIAFDQIQDNTYDMRVREFSLRDQRSPAQTLPPLTTKSRKRPAPTGFDADDYIEHIEKELQQTRDEAFSPLTRRPMKEKLRAANRENERLQGELTQLREKFETEVKRTVEHKTVTELELKRRVRELEDLLEEKEHSIREFQYQYEERRLENNIISSLKANIERLEQDKVDMEEINLSMSKRNEVLTQLLAMSPTKATDGFILGSPGREKRQGRPISLILPRHVSPPSATPFVAPNSLVCSPRALNSADISPFKLSPDQDLLVQPIEPLHRPLTTPREELGDPMSTLKSPVMETKSRRSTMYSDVSATSSGPVGGTMLASDERLPARRKARRFMGGSTQLKPLLLPTLAGESQSIPSTSTASSPRSWPTRALSEVDVDDTILASEDHEIHVNIHANSTAAVSGSHGLPEEEGPGPAYVSSVRVHPNKRDPSHQLGSPVVATERSKDSELLFARTTDAEETVKIEEESRTTRSQVAELSTEHLRQHDSCYSLQMMPMPSTPESLISLPQPLFSSHRKVALDLSMDVGAEIPSGSPFAPDDPWQVNVRKKRKHSLGIVDLNSPASKIHRRHQRRHSCGDLIPETTLSAPRINSATTSTTSASNRLSQIRSSDNFVDLLRQKNFAARPLAAMTIRTVFTLLSTCTSVVRSIRRDPFALARRVLANAWRMNWKVLGKISWWVLGLFIQPQARSKARAPIDWDQYDGESIASRYCGSITDHEDRDSVVSVGQEHLGTSLDHLTGHHGGNAVLQEEKPRWGRSIYLWGKFSAALMLAVGGAVIKGPGEMLKDMNVVRDKAYCHKSCASCSKQQSKAQLTQDQSQSSSSRDNTHTNMLAAHLPINNGQGERCISDSDVISQLDSSSLLNQIQQGDEDSTLRPEASARRRIDSLFHPASSSEDLASRLQELRLSGSHTESSALDIHDPEPRYSE